LGIFAQNREKYGSASKAFNNNVLIAISL